MDYFDYIIWLPLELIWGQPIVALDGGKIIGVKLLQMIKGTGRLLRMLVSQVKRELLETGLKTRHLLTPKIPFLMQRD